MRRMVIAATALLCLAFAGSAYAATTAPTSSNNGGTASFKVSGGTKAGSPVTMVEQLGTSPATGFGTPYPLANILTKVQGVASPDAKYFPKCTVAQINAGGSSNGSWNGVCPKGSEVADGTLISVIVPNTTSNPMLSTASAIANPCTLGLHVYNAGGSNLAYFFTVASGACGPLDTGAALPYPGTVVSKGGYAVNNVPEDANISFEAGGLPAWGALLSENLKWSDTVKVHGKQYSYLVSTGCKKTRKYSAQFTATNYTGSGLPPTASAPASSDLAAVTVTGSSKC
jgi:hypothetical protein